MNEQQERDFDKWWDSDQMTEDNPFAAETKGFWAWEGWMARAALAANVPDGYKLVPVEPTPEMLHCAEMWDDGFPGAWSRALAAAPAPEAEFIDGDCVIGWVSQPRQAPAPEADEVTQFRERCMGLLDDGGKVEREWAERLRKATAPAPEALPPRVHELLAALTVNDNPTTRARLAIELHTLLKVAPAQAQQAEPPPTCPPMTADFKSGYEAWREDKPEAQQPKGLTTERLRQMHHEDEFGLFCDFDEFEQIARAVEQEHSIKAIAAKAKPEARQHPDTQDAERYRWLRRWKGQEHEPPFTVHHELDGTLWGGDLDAAIDDAIAASKESGNGQ